MVVVRANKVPTPRQYSPRFPVKPCNFYGIAVRAVRAFSLLVRFANGFGDLTGTDVIYCWIYSIIIFLLADCAKLIFIASFHITSGVLEELPDDHEAHDEEEHIDDDHKELLQGKRGSVHKRPKVAATNPKNRSSSATEPIPHCSS